jgi:hypothetical protein
MSTAAKRLMQLRDDLSVTQAVMAWLEEAYAFGSQAEYITWASAELDRNPLLVLPLQMIRTVQKAGKGQPKAAIQQTTERAVREVLIRVQLILWVNDHLVRERRADLIELELLTDTLPLALAKRASDERQTRWRTRASDLGRDAFTWELAGQALAERYFGGQAPFFPDVQEHFSETTRTLDRLIGRWSQAGPSEAIELVVLQGAATGRVEPLVQHALADARRAAGAFLGERSGEFRVPRLMDYAERVEGKA